MKYAGLGELLPKIQVSPPGPKSNSLTESLRKHEIPAGCTVPQPVIWEYAKGSNVVDVDGNIYIDLSGGFGVAAVGYSHPRIVEAIKSQTNRLMHAPGKSSPHPRRIELAKKLTDITPTILDKSYITNTGALAVEVAMKAAKAFKKSYWFIAFHGGFHGNNVQGALSLTAYKEFRNIYQPLLPGVVHVPYAYCYRCAFGKEYPDCDMQCLKYLEYVVADPATGVGQIAAVVVEPVQGVGGWVIPPKEFLQGIRKICDENNILLILDEIYTGFGRTGKLFCYQHSNVTPDIMAVGKGMASGFPISATIGRGDVMEKFGPHTGTFIANPVGCACALASIEVIVEEKLAERAKNMGTYFLKGLTDVTEKIEIVGEARGVGLLVGLELVKNRRNKKPAVEEAEKTVLSALKRGLIFHRGGVLGNFLRISPPLVITRDQIDYSVEVIRECLKEAMKT